MPTYEFLIHTSGIRYDLGDGESPVIGFYTSRRARAKTPEEAYTKVLALMDDDPKLVDLFDSGHRAGLRPCTELEETYLIPWWRSLIPWKEPALAMYPEDDESGPEGAS